MAGTWRCRSRGRDCWTPRRSRWLAAPDTKQLAYSVLYLDQMYHILGGDIVVSDADGSNQQVVVHEEELGYAVGWPAWTFAWRTP